MKTYFWTLNLTSQSVASCIWTREDDETAILGLSEDIKSEAIDEYAPAADAALASLADSVPEEAGTPENVVFGVLGSWVSDGSIKKEKLSFIKKICDDLTLKPVGFVVFAESIAHWVKQEEGGPLTAVVIALNRDGLEVTIFKLGTPQGTINVGRSTSVSEDIVEALIRFGHSDPLPSRFLIYGASQEDLKDSSSEISNTDWEELSAGKISFLHSPKVEIVGTRDLLVAVSVAGSSEMGPIKTLTVPELEEEEYEKHANLEHTPVTPNDLGFVMDSDILKVTPQEVEESETFEEEETQLLHGTKISKSSALRVKLLSTLSHLSSLKKIFSKKRVAKNPEITHALPKKKKVKIRLAALGLILGSLLIAFLFAWYFLPKAEITIFVSPRVLSTSESVTLKSDITEPDLSSKLLPAVLLTKSVTGSDSTTATGVKVVGEKAHGSVTIRNGTSSGIKITAGALLTAANDLKFVVDETASVSAAISPTTPGTVTVAATAYAIGSDYNVSENTSMKVGNFSTSEIDAVSQTTFSGGSSRQINAVSKADLDGLERSLTASLTDQAKEELSSQVSDTDVFISDSVTTSVNSKTFDRKVGDEADSINLNLSITASGYVVPKSALSKMATELLSSQVPSGFSFRSENTQSSFTTQKGASGTVANVSLTANLLPNIKPDEVSRGVRGKSLTKAQEYLSTIPGFVRAAITISPSFPTPFKVLPWVVSHILVSVEAER